MSTVLTDSRPFETVLGFALLRDEHGREMHKSWGNTIPFDEAADRAGADMMRWLFVQHNPEQNLNFGFSVLDDVKKRLLVLWHAYSFFVTYANVDGWIPTTPAPTVSQRSLLDRWVLARLSEMVYEVREGLNDYDSRRPALAIERFVEDLSTWYIRLSRRRFWKSENDADKLGAYATLYQCLATLARLLAPFMPFVSEELYQNLIRTHLKDAPLSVHLDAYPKQDHSLLDLDLLNSMAVAQKVVSLGRAARERANIEVKQPLSRLFLRVPSANAADAVGQVQDLILDELNVRALEFASEEDELVEHVVRPNLPRLGPRFGKLLPLVRAAIGAANTEELVRASENRESIRLRLDTGQEIELAPEDILVSTREREGFAAMASDGFLVALDTQLTEDLIDEWLARTTIRHLNSWRKDAGFNVDDRIHVKYDASDKLARAIDLHRSYIARETLATSLTATESFDGGFVGEARIGDEVLKAEIARTGA
jgi:isoleucyl-tRNA synthetase